MMGKVPTIQIDKSDGVQIYLSKESLGCEIFSAKSSEMNVSVPSADGDFVSAIEWIDFLLFPRNLLVFAG